MPLYAGNFFLFLINIDYLEYVNDTVILELVYKYVPCKIRKTDGKKRENSSFIDVRSAEQSNNA